MYRGINYKCLLSISVSCYIVYVLHRFSLQFCRIEKGRILYGLVKNICIFVLYFIAQNAYCSRDIYFQFNKVRRSVILRAIMQRLYESASAIGCKECTTKLINIL